MSVVPANSGGGGLLNREWWRLCLVHGDQTKYYRQLYGHKRAAIRTTQRNQNGDDAEKKVSSAVPVDAAASAGGVGGQCAGSAACRASTFDIVPG